MKSTLVSFLFLLLITLMFIGGCKKDNAQNNIVPKVEYPGNYSFTTIFHSTGSPDTTMLYDGFISYDDFDKHWTIMFLSNHEIHPNIDSIGVMSDKYCLQQTGCFFSGNMDNFGNVNFISGETITHHGDVWTQSYTVKGKKKQTMEQKEHCMNHPGEK